MTIVNSLNNSTSSGVIALLYTLKVSAGRRRDKQLFIYRLIDHKIRIRFQKLGYRSFRIITLAPRTINEFDSFNILYRRIENKAKTTKNVLKRYRFLGNL
jgi:hypothetical protein